MTSKFFNDLHLKFSRKEYLNSDPIEFCYLFQNKLDIELVGFLSAMFSYGNVKSIKTYLSNLIQLLTPSPSEFLLKKDLQTIRNKLHYYRFQKSEDVYRLLVLLQSTLSERRSLEYFFGNKKISTPERIIHFQLYFMSKHREIFKSEYSNGLKFLLGNGNLNSTNKRYHMFLRWMVRKDFPDFGLYTSFSPKDLFYPMDVHLGKISEILLGKKPKSAFKQSIAFTEYMRNYFPDDPVRMDFVFSRLGILKFCKLEYVDSICKKCELKKNCSILKSSHPSG
ncbi:MAG: TIGR02757 family protein [Leptospiraceae bacterium]|nr:TIGR02757 family protein [Leptospiraceae bacterium]MCP5512004.1 TIGR02757 family protein [Leptospiraceae bacterium]